MQRSLIIKSSHFYKAKGCLDFEAVSAASIWLPTMDKVVKFNDVLALLEVLVIACINWKPTDLSGCTDSCSETTRWNAVMHGYCHSEKVASEDALMRNLLETGSNATSFDTGKLLGPGPDIPKPICHQPGLSRHALPSWPQRLYLRCWRSW